MRKKKAKKLTLGKETLRALTDANVNEVAGGATTRANTDCGSDCDACTGACGGGTYNDDCGTGSGGIYC